MTAPQQPAALPPGGACGVVTADNATLLHALSRRGSVPSAAPLLVLLIANATLGPGLQPGAVAIERPVVIAGAATTAGTDAARYVWQLAAAAPASPVCTLCMRLCSSAQQPLACSKVGDAAAAALPWLARHRAGLFSRPTSVDLGMVVNQLNVTAPLSKLFWQSVVLENLAPGDGLTSSVAPPYSAALSGNVWAMFCNRCARRAL